MRTRTAVSPWHHVYYLTRPDFIKHDHIHKPRVAALRSANLHASLIAFVPQALFEQRRAEYLALSADGLRHMVCVPDASQVNESVRKFLLKRLLTLKRLLIHVLLCDPAPVLKLKRLPFFGRRLTCLIEHEGDIASECLYRWAYPKFSQPPDAPPTEYQPTYNYIVAEQKGHLLQADGAILVTPEHLALWEQRLGRPLNACTLPTYFDPAQFRFSPAARDSLRSELGLHGKIVFVYSGSVALEWQRFESVCQFVARLSQRGPPVHLLALVHSDGHAAANQVIQQSGLDRASTLKAVAPGDMPRYLSAADVALFLRHNHVMNRIVTSAKLGEYLAAGLPLVTTWACPYYRPLAEKHGASLALPDSLELPPGFDRTFAALAAKGANPSWRAEFSQAVQTAVSGQNDPLNAYVAFITRMLQETNSQPKGL
jgi:glycosyltransferase involved in cell wall biosynthesis